MGINHMFAVSFLVKALKPKAIIESGISAGHGTFLLRDAAGPSVPIFSFDAEDPAKTEKASAVGHWRDQSAATKYFVAANFTDISEADWDTLLPDRRIRARTFVVLNDHQSSVQRFQLLQRLGFRWVYYNDNYPYEAATSPDPSTCANSPTQISGNFDAALIPGDAYSPNSICGAPLSPGTKKVLVKDKSGSNCSYISAAEHNQNVQYMEDNTLSYFEFPPLFSRCSPHRPSLLGSDPAVLETYKLPSIDEELWSYGCCFLQHHAEAMLV
jgi:hypothetical protein